MAYGDFKDLNIITAVDNVLRDEAFNVAKNPFNIAKYDRYQRELASVVYKCFDKKLLVEPLRLQINLHLKIEIFLIKN